MELSIDITNIEKAVDLMNQYVELLKEARELSSTIASITHNLDLNIKTCDPQED